jgi:hypothetical protein
MEKTIRSLFAVPKKPPLTLIDPDFTGIGPPRKLGKHGLTLWQSVQREYAVTDVGGIELLMLACGGTDRLEAIAARINEDGKLIRTRNGARAHPLIREETSLRAFICRTLEKLGITQEKIKTPGRPPGSFAEWAGE